MKYTVLALVAALVVAPLAFAHLVPSPAPAEAQLTTATATSFFQAVTPDFLRSTQSVCSTGLDSSCSDVCVAQHYACAIAICGQPCFTEPCLSELSDCLNACN